MTFEARAKELFLDALEREGEEREGFLRSACGDDARLAARVASLFVAHEQAERRLGRPTPLALVPGMRFGPYRLIEPLGEGGFGLVWRARQEVPVRRDVALKVLRGEAARGDGLARFELERQALASLTHPGIARVFDGGTEQGRPWFAMERIDGPTITAHVEASGADVAERLALFLDVCRAIQHAHQRGIIHRDIKPSNVLVSLADAEPAVRVIDFGIAQVTDEGPGIWTRRTLTGQVLGTPGFMSPEQLAETRDVDTRTDIYSLGVLLYELLVGAPPFAPDWLREKGPSEALRILREDDPPRPSTRALTLGGVAATRARQLRGELDWIVLRCLEKDRERRYGSVADLIADLERQRRGEPVLAGPPSRLYRARKFARRHALGLGALTAVGFALVIGAGLATLEMRRAQRAERAAAAAAAQARLETERSQSIAEFLEHLLLSIDPAVAQGRDVSLLREVLDNAATGIADRGDRPPAVEASLRRVIGGAYASLADFEPALAQLRQALELRRAALGEDDVATIELEGELAGVLLRAGRLSEAEAPMQDALERARRVFGPDDERTLTLLGNHATLQRSLGRSGPALALLRELEERRIATKGPEDAATLLATNNLALALLDEGRLEEGAERLRKVMEAQLAQVGERHPRALAAMSNYAAVLDDLGRMKEAEALLRRVLALKLEVLDPTHPSVIVSWNNLANFLGHAGRYEEALELLDQALDSVRPNTDQEAKLLLNHSQTLRRLGRPEEAVEDARRATEAAVASTGEDSALVQACDECLANALLDAGHAEEAEPLYRRLVERLDADSGASPADRADAHLRLGLALLGLERLDEAGTELRGFLSAATPSAEWSRRARAALDALTE